MLRGAVIGFGNVAIHGHLPGWLGRPDVRIVAAADARPGQRAECDARLPGARWYDSPDDLLAGEPLDFVDICTPPSSHAPIIWSALGRGLHVLCEKPLVSSHGDLARVTSAATSAARVLHTVHNWHHAPMLSLTDELIRQGEIGQVQRIVWETLRVRPATAGDGSGLGRRAATERRRAARDAAAHGLRRRGHGIGAARVRRRDGRHPPDLGGGGAG